jgi:hypothetical protein
MNEGAKITASHLARHTVVYLRQSSAAQVEHNRESTERQYALASKARELGWPAERIVVIEPLSKRKFPRPSLPILRRPNVPRSRRRRPRRRPSGNSATGAGTGNDMSDEIVEAGGSLRDMLELAGHTSLATTQKYIQG